MSAAAGSVRIYLSTYLSMHADTSYLPSLPLLRQPYFQNTIAQLAAAWFPPRERTLATAIAFLSPVLGVMFSFLIGTCLVRHSDELDPYLAVRRPPTHHTLTAHA